MNQQIRYFQKCFLLVGILFVSILSFSQSADVKVIPRPTNPYMAYNDLTKKKDFLSSSQKDIIEQKLRDFYNETSNELVIVILDTLDGIPLNDVSYAYAKGWSFGNKQKDNGILLLVSKGDKKIRIETGRGIDFSLNAGEAGAIIRNEISPNFKNRDYFNGLLNGVNGIIQQSKGSYVMDNMKDRRDSKSSSGSFWPIIVMIIVVFIVLAIINKRGGGGNGGMLSRRGYRRWGGPTVFDYGPWSGGGWSSGSSGGGGNSGGWGDFGGFGGGDFGGGGASGDW